MVRKTRQHITARTTRWALFLLLLVSVPLFAQDAPVPQPVPGTPLLLKLEGDDPESGHYVRLLLLLAQAGDANTTDAPPRLTLECIAKDGRGDLRVYVNFGGIKDMNFTPPFHRKPGVPYQAVPTYVKLKMRFVGYMNWQPYVESWTLMRNGELRYRDPGLHSPNLESIPFVLKMLHSLPGLRIVHQDRAAGDPGEVFFETKPLLDEMKKTPACNL